MKLAYSILADAASVANGKVFILGGEVNTVYAAAFPALHTRLSLVVRFDIGPEDLPDVPHSFRVDMAGPLDSIFLKGEVVDRRLDAQRDSPELPAKVLMTFDFPPLFLPIAGKYEIRLIVDEQEVTSIPFLVVLTPSR